MPKTGLQWSEGFAPMACLPRSLPVNRFCTKVALHFLRNILLVPFFYRFFNTGLCVKMRKYVERYPWISWHVQFSKLHCALTNVTRLHCGTITEETGQHTQWSSRILLLQQLPVVSMTHDSNARHLWECMNSYARSSSNFLSLRPKSICNLSLQRCTVGILQECIASWTSAMSGWWFVACWQLVSIIYI